MAAQFPSICYIKGVYAAQSNLRINRRRLACSSQDCGFTRNQPIPMFLFAASVVQSKPSQCLHCLSKCVQVFLACLLKLWKQHTTLQMNLVVSAWEHLYSVPARLSLCPIHTHTHCRHFESCSINQNMSPVLYVKLAWRCVLISTLVVKKLCFSKSSRPTFFRKKHMLRSSFFCLFFFCNCSSNFN